MASSAKTACDRCGTCCTKGGPTLHQADSSLLSLNMLKPEHLITIRQGEPVFSLEEVKSKPARSEIIKVKGQGNSWTCLFYDEKSTQCTIYDHRPMECSLLKCWDTAELEGIAGKNLLNRHDIIDQDNPAWPYIQSHEELCPLGDLTRLVSDAFRETGQQSLVELSRLVNVDLAVRAQACNQLNCSLELELFYFGRPLFLILEQYSIKIYEDKGMYNLAIASPEKV